jgi:nucleotide-binding universal stress UspA family protein
VVGCGGTISSDTAIRFAAREARMRGAELVVVIAYPRPVDPDVPSFYVADSELRSRARLVAEQAICRALGLPGGALPEGALPEGALPELCIVTEPGPASRILLRGCREAQLLVLGGRQGRRWQGSTVRYVTRHSAVPVVIVPATEPPALDRVGSGPGLVARPLSWWRRRRRGPRPGR